MKTFHELQAGDVFYTYEIHSVYHRDAKGFVVLYYATCQICGKDKFANERIMRDCRTCRKMMMARWRNMLARCYDDRTEAYSDYGGRGIAVCRKWRNNFDAFYKFMGNPPSATHSIDRIDNDGDYEPGNVRWATPAQQAGNKRKRKIGRNPARSQRAAAE